MSAPREKVTIVGCGGWGERIARKLVARGDVDVVLVDDDQQRVRGVADELGVAWSSDPYGYLLVSGTARSTVERGSVIVATPPDTRMSLVSAILDGYGLPPKRLRVEKPLAIDPQDAWHIAQACDYAGVRLSVGFTLLHHFLYERAFAYIEHHGLEVVRVVGSRIGKRARHRAAALVDLGAHTASIGAYLDAPCVIHTEYSDVCAARVTQLMLGDGSSVYIDELNGTCTLPTEWAVSADEYTDPLEADLNAWLRDEHRGSANVGVVAAETIWQHLEQLAVHA